MSTLLLELLHFLQTVFSSMKANYAVTLFKMYECTKISVCPSKYLFVGYIAVSIIGILWIFRHPISK